MRSPYLRLKRLDLSGQEGRIFFCGDVHGYLAGLMECLNRQGFDPSIDRVFAAGDLIDRGPDSQGCLRLLEQPWFDSVMGNHEQMLIQYMAGEIDAIEWGLNGGRWATQLPRYELEALQSLIVNTMPLAFEIKTPKGRIGLVHANAPEIWSDVADLDRVDEDLLLWSRTRAHCALHGYPTRPVEGIDAVVLGHTCTKTGKPMVTSNQMFLDTRNFVELMAGLSENADIDLTTGMTVIESSQVLEACAKQEKQSI